MAVPGQQLPNSSARSVKPQPVQPIQGGFQRRLIARTLCKLYGCMFGSDAARKLWQSVVLLYTSHATRCCAGANARTLFFVHACMQELRSPALPTNLDSTTSCSFGLNSYAAEAEPAQAGALAAAGTSSVHPVHTSSAPSTTGFGTSASGQSTLPVSSSSYADYMLVEERAKLAPLSCKIVQQYEARLQRHCCQWGIHSFDSTEGVATV